MEEKNLYFYHPDHLGSSSYITDKNGEVIQHTEYMAFGEVFVDEHSTSNKQPYLFNGKELDYETGLYYYGARYYDPKTSIFLNVDPLVEKTGTPYAYTYNNPIRFIDLTGMQGEDWVEKDNRFFWDSRVKSQEDAERYWGQSAIHHRPNEYGYQSSQGYVLLSDDAKWVRNGKEYTAPDEGSFINVLIRNITGSQEFYNFYTSEGGRRYEGMGKDLLKTGDIVSWINFDEIIKPSLPTSNTLSSFAEAFKNIGDLWGMRIRRKNDSLHYHTWTIDEKGSFKDTIIRAPYYQNTEGFYKQIYKKRGEKIDKYYESIKKK